jgi:putative phosphoesterase
MVTYMRIAVLSDSHGRNETVRRALAEIAKRGISTVLHCGDIEDPATIALFAGLDAHFVLGNCDWDADAIGRAIQGIGATLHDGFGNLKLADRKIAFLHGHEKERMHEMEYSGYFDYLFYGHTHIAKEHVTGSTRVINPGALHRANPKTFIVVDLASAEVESVVIG